MAATNPLNLQIDANPGTWAIEDSLFSILTTYLPSSSTSTPQSAASQINVLHPLHRTDTEPKEEPSSFLSEFWDLMFRVISQVDYTSEPALRFVELIKALKNSPGEGDEKEGIWRELPGMSYQIGEVWNRFDTTSMTPDSEAFSKFKNLNGILALLSNEGLAEGAYLTLSRLALGLEQDDTVTGKTEKSVKTQLEIHLPIAALWVTTSTAYVYKLCNEKAYSDEAGRDSILWKGEKGYSLERWAVWKARFAELQSHRFVTAEGKVAAQSAVTQMNAVSAP